VTFEEAIETVRSKGFLLWSLRQETSGTWRCQLAQKHGFDQHRGRSGVSQEENTGITLSVSAPTVAGAILAALGAPDMVKEKLFTGLDACPERRAKLKDAAEASVKAHARLAAALARRSANG
jgi:hypothetical protein